MFLRQFVQEHSFFYFKVLINLTCKLFFDVPYLFKYSLKRLTNHYPEAIHVIQLG